MGVAILLVATVAPAAARSLHIVHFEAGIEVAASGGVTVTEVITARFEGAWNGLYRTIPIEYRTPQGFGFRLHLKPEGAFDKEGNPLRWQASRERHYRKIKIWVPGATDVTRTVVLIYRVRNALSFLEDHDELYWNVTGDEWDVPIEDAAARITLPDGATGLRATAFTGSYGSRERDADLAIEAHAVTVRLRRSLGFREGLTVVIGWDKGAVAAPGPVARAIDVLAANWPLVAPFVAFGIMGWLWWTRGRDPELHPIAVRYEPPEGLSPAEVGTLADYRADVRDITATLVDLAVRGFLTIEEKTESRLLGLFSRRDFVLRRHVQAPVPGRSKAHEVALMRGLFEGRGDVVELSDLENDFYKHLPRIRDGVYEALVRGRYYADRPDAVHQRYGIAAALLALLGAGAAFFGNSPLVGALGAGPMAFALGGLGTGVIVLAFGWFMPARTVRGTRALEEVRGFEEFLSRVEADRLERVVRTPELFERFLPFAMALGVESQWARAFEGICQQPPRWYQGGSIDGFRPRIFVDRLEGMTRTAAATMVSRPRSTGSGSGFGGGGSSGGGLGGGGGGGF
jgi:hypothetical protein